MIFFKALFFIVLLALANVPAFASELIASDPVFLADCEASLRGMANERLGIAVLAEGEDHFYHLARAPYAGTNHEGVSLILNRRSPIHRIIWLGEMHFRLEDGGQIFLIKANETSGLFQRTRSKGTLSLLDREVPVENAVDNIPNHFRDENFKGIRFGQGSKHLALELNQYDGNIRHSINNALQVLISLRGMLNNEKLSKEQKEQLIWGPRTRSQAALVRWFLLNLVQERRVDFNDMPQMLMILSLLCTDSNDPTRFLDVNVDALSAEVRILSNLISPQEFAPLVQIHSLRSSD